MYRLNEKLRDLQPYDPNPAEDKIHLDANESFLTLPPGILETAALEETAFNRYPDPAARELCRAFGERYGVPLENIVAGNGSDELISVLFLAFLEKGDAFATLEPDFSMYGFNGFLNEARQVFIPKGPGCVIDVERTVETCGRENVKLLIFSNPCNPTGLVLPREQVRRLVRGVEGLVILDEAYMDFSDQSLLGEIEDFDNLLILRTCSKAIGMAALRLGFAVGRRELVDAVKAAKAPYNVNTLSQRVGAAALRRGDLLDQALAELLASRDQLKEGLESLAGRYPGRFELLPSHTNFIALLLDDGEAAYDWLWNQGIAVRLTRGMLRVTCGKAEENQAFLAAFESYFKEG